MERCSLLLQSFPHGGVLERKVQRRVEGDGGGVRAGNHVDHQVGDDLSVVDHMGERGFCFDELIEEVRLAWVVVCGVSALEAVDEVLDGDVGDGSERRWADPVDGVLVQEVVENGQLTHQRKIIHGLVGNGDGVVEIIALFEVSDGFTEGDFPHHVPGIYNNQQ